MEIGSEIEISKVHKSMGRPKKQLVAEERAKREIANSNERRRMQSINSGFSCLRQILRQHNNIEKHSKAAILHQSATYIRKLEQDIHNYTEQNQMLKNFIDNYRKSPDNQVKNTEECLEERDGTDDRAYGPPNKKLKTSDDMPVTSSPGGSHNSGNNGMNKISVLQSPKELTEILEKEVLELRSLLERERLVKSELQAKHQSLDFRFQTKGCPQVFDSSSSVFAINHMPNTPSIATPLAIPYHNTCEDRPLDLKTTKSFKDFPLISAQNSNSHFGPHINRPSLAFRPRYTSPVFTATKMYSPDLHFNKQAGNFKQIKQEHPTKNVQQNPFSFQTPVSNDQDQLIPLPLVKKASLAPLSNGMPSTTFSSHQSSGIDPTASMSSSVNRPNPVFKDNIELILKAIHYIEGQDYKSGDPSAYVKHLAEKLSIKSTSVLKHLLSNEYRNGTNKRRPTVHSVDSLL